MCGLDADSARIGIKIYAHICLMTFEYTPPAQLRSHITYNISICVICFICCCVFLSTGIQQSWRSESVRVKWRNDAVCQWRLTLDHQGMNRFIDHTIKLQDNWELVRIYHLLSDSQFNLDDGVERGHWGDEGRPLMYARQRLFRTAFLPVVGTLRIPEAFLPVVGPQCLLPLLFLIICCKI